MKAIFIIIGIIIIATIIAGHYAAQNVDWSSVDQDGTIVTVVPNLKTGNPSKYVIYVQCQMNGKSYTMTAQACSNAQNVHEGLEP